MTKGKELVKNTVIMLVGKIFTQFLSFLMLPLYTNLLPKDQYGVVDLIASYLSIAIPVTTIQLEMAAFRYLVDTRDDKNKQSEVLKTTFRDLIIRIILFSIPYLIIVQFIDFQYKYITLACGISIAISNLLLQVSRGVGKNATYTVGSVFAGIVTVVSNLVLICLLGMGAESILISMMLANMACSLFLAWKLRSYWHMGGVRASRRLSRTMIKYSWPLVPNSISWWLINSSDRTIVSIVLGVAANGTYAVACKFPLIVSSFIGVFSYSWTESASLHINDPDRDEFFSSVANNALRIFTGIGVCVIAFLPLIFDIVVGANYRDSYNYIPIAVVAVIFNSLVLIYSAIYVAKKLTKKVAMTSIVSAIINIVVDLVLIHFIGLYAAVLSTAVAYLSMAIYRHFDVKKYVMIKYDLKSLVFATLGLVVIFFIYYSNIFILYLVGAVAAVIFAIGLNWGIISAALRGGGLKKRLKRLGK